MILNDIVATLQFLLIKVLTFTVYYVLSNVYDTLYQRVADQLCLFVYNLPLFTVSDGKSEKYILIN